MEPRTVSAPVRQIPNALTLLRFAAIPVFVWLLLDERSGPSWPAGIVFGAGGGAPTSSTATSRGAGASSRSSARSPTRSPTG